MNTTRRRPRNRQTYLPHLGNIFNEVMNTAMSDIVKDDAIHNFKPKANVLESDKEYLLNVAIPGYTKKDIEIKVENKQLKISGKVEGSSDSDFKLREFRMTEFSRSFHLPKNVDSDAIAASFKNGILAIAITKKVEAQPKTISIK